MAVKRKGYVPRVVSLCITAIATLIFIINRFSPSEPIAPVKTPTASGSCSVHFIDVGQGDCSLILCGGKTVLIDAGENNRGDEVVIELKRLKVDSIDYIIGTHPHSDHIGGLDTVIDSFPVSHIILPNIADDMVPTTKTYIDLLESIEKSEAELIAAKPGLSFDIGGGTLTLFSPVSDRYSSLNDWSVVSKFAFGSVSFLFTGDAEKAVETDILSGGADISADVLKAGHHGSNTSTTPPFLKKVNPKYAVIDVGAGNSYNHPSNDTLSALSARGIKIFRTDICGTIVAVTDGKEISFSTQKQEVN